MVPGVHLLCVFIVLHGGERLPLAMRRSIAGGTALRDGTSARPKKRKRLPLKIHH
jgi:hypothetical protein